MFKRGLVLLAVLTIAGLLLSYHIDKPFWGHHDFNNAFYGNMARNLIRYGPVATKLGQVTSSGFMAPASFSYHTHHPSMLIWLLAVSYWLLGISEVSTRLVPVFFSLLSVLYFYRLIALTFDKRMAFWGALFWIITPIYLYFGKMAIHEILVLFAAMFAFYQYELWIKSRDRKNYRLLILGIIFGGLSGWPAYYIVPVLTLFDILREKTVRKPIFLLWLFPIIPLSFHLLQTGILTGSVFGGGIDQAFSLRASAVPLGEFLKNETSWATAYFTKPLFLLALLGLTVSIWHKRSRFLLMLLIFGLLHPLIFRQAAFRHDYLIYYLLPFFAAASAYLVSKISGKFALIIVVLAIIQSKSFTLALLQSDYGKDGYLTGMLVRTNTPPQAKILLADQEIYNNSSWVATFYADRYLYLVPDTTNKPSSDFNYVITRSPNSGFTLKSCQIPIDCFH